MFFYFRRTWRTRKKTPHVVVCKADLFLQHVKNTLGGNFFRISCRFLRSHVEEEGQKIHS